MGWEEHDNYSFLQGVVAQQVRVYNSDPASHFLRFYQTWLEQQALYLTFEVGSGSLFDDPKSLREVEVWDLLRDCCAALSWLTEEQGLWHLNIKPGNIIKCQRKFKLTDPYCTQATLQSYLHREGNQWGGWLYLAP